MTQQIRIIKGTTRETPRAQTNEASPKFTSANIAPSAPEAPPTAASAETTSNAAPPESERGGLFNDMKGTCAAYTKDHRHAVCYGIVGFVAAALVLIIGFWPTVLLALFAAAGIAIGRYRDGNQKTRAALKSLISRMQ